MAVALIHPIDDEGPLGAGCAVTVGGGGAVTVTVDICTLEVGNAVTVADVSLGPGGMGPPMCGPSVVGPTRVRVGLGTVSVGPGAGAGTSEPYLKEFATATNRSRIVDSTIKASPTTINRRPRRLLACLTCWPSTVFDPSMQQA
jgi:hypothetical protein